VQRRRRPSALDGAAGGKWHWRHPDGRRSFEPPSVPHLSRARRVIMAASKTDQDSAQANRGQAAQAVRAMLAPPFFEPSAAGRCQLIVPGNSKPRDGAGSLRRRAGARLGGGLALATPSGWTTALLTQIGFQLSLTQNST